MSEGILVLPAPRKILRRTHARLIMPERVIIIREDLGRRFPSWRRYVLWHEFQHFRLFENGHRGKLSVHILLDFLSGAGYPIWRLFQ